MKPSQKTLLPASVTRALRLAAVTAFLIAGALWVGLNVLFGLSVNAAAQSLGPIAMLETWVPWLVIFGAVFLILAWMGGKGEKALISGRAKNVLRTFGWIFVVMALIGFVVPTIVLPPPPTCDDDPATALPPCGDPLFAFDVQASVGTTAGSTVPAGNYDDCDTEAGGTTGEWTTTEGTWDPTSNLFIGRVAIDTDLAASAGLWSDPNCFELTFTVRLAQPVDQNNDGVNDAISYYASIDTIGRTIFTTDGTNGTLNTPIFAQDGISETADWYLLYLNDGSVWIPACSEWRGRALGSSCAPVAVGSHNGVAAVDTITVYIIIGGGSSVGAFAYQEPAVGSTIPITGTMAGFRWTLNIVLNSRGTTNLS